MDGEYFLVECSRRSCRFYYEIRSQIESRLCVATDKGKELPEESARQRQLVVIAASTAW